VKKVKYKMRTIILALKVQQTVCIKTIRGNAQNVMMGSNKPRIQMPAWKNIFKNAKAINHQESVLRVMMDTSKLRTLMHV